MEKVYIFVWDTSLKDLLTPKKDTVSTGCTEEDHILQIKLAVTQLLFIGLIQRNIFFHSNHISFDLVKQYPPIQKQMRPISDQV